MSKIGVGLTFTFVDVTPGTNKIIHVDRVTLLQKNKNIVGFQLIRLHRDQGKVLLCFNLENKIQGEVRLWGRGTPD